MLGKITQRSLGLSGNKGVAFFSFPGVTSPNKFKQLYRGRMNCIDLTEQERRDVIDEATRAFEFNIEVRIYFAGKNLFCINEKVLKFSKLLTCIQLN